MLMQSKRTVQDQTIESIWPSFEDSQIINKLVSHCHIYEFQSKNTFRFLIENYFMKFEVHLPDCHIRQNLEYVPPLRQMYP